MGCVIFFLGGAKARVLSSPHSTRVMIILNSKIPNRIWSIVVKRNGLASCQNALPWVTTMTRVRQIEIYVFFLCVLYFWPATLWAVPFWLGKNTCTLDYEEYDGEEDEDEDEEEEVQKPSPLPKKPETTVTEPEIEYTVKVSGEVVDEVSTTTATSTTAASEADAVTDVNIVVQPTVDPYTPRVLNQSCGPDKGGCDHNCEMVLYPGENEARVVCSCYSGFTLDPYNYRGCHGKNQFF